MFLTRTLILIFQLSQRLRQNHTKAVQRSLQPLYQERRDIELETPTWKSFENC